MRTTKKNAGFIASPSSLLHWNRFIAKEHSCGHGHRGSILQGPTKDRASFWLGKVWFWVRKQETESTRVATVQPTLCIDYADCGVPISNQLRACRPECAAFEIPAPVSCALKTRDCCSDREDNSVSSSSKGASTGHFKCCLSRVTSKNTRQSHGVYSFACFCAAALLFGLKTKKFSPSCKFGRRQFSEKLDQTCCVLVCSA